jgi:hypothetical protein
MSRTCEARLVSRAGAVRVEEAHASREKGDSPLTRADYRLFRYWTSITGPVRCRRGTPKRLETRLCELGPPEADARCIRGTPAAGERTWPGRAHRFPGPCAEAAVPPVRSLPASRQGAWPMRLPMVNVTPMATAPRAACRRPELSMDLPVSLPTAAPPAIRVTAVMARVAVSTG